MNLGTNWGLRKLMYIPCPHLTQTNGECSANTFNWINHSAFSKQVKQYIESHNAASVHTACREQLWRRVVPHQAGGTLDGSSFLHLLLLWGSSHSQTNFCRPPVNAVFIGLTGKKAKMVWSCNIWERCKVVKDHA